MCIEWFTNWGQKGRILLLGRFQNHYPQGHSAPQPQPKPVDRKGRKGRKGKPKLKIETGSRSQTQI